ncbi:YwhD family protein [Aneurinibacillus sp. Ricciae_BoGa-3]|uniref:YwhD family protein n=1 Tax=Aneurinibacillus sp. Ricciae_BoGa-3 TaxID=3022697 RepID=UPI00233F83C9|nr:YwhD family protein [Aneurinibacillus sp. Ricciae_BoGa-3]WCK54389.1 YwhD family protein [Aneurinibacillus sp. Ricciae_BoGa-3]
MELFNNKGKQGGFNIISNKNQVHGGYGAGTIDLGNVSSIIVDEETAVIDIGAMHAKSAVEKGIKFSANKEDVPNGKTYWLVWVAVDQAEGGAYYAGVTACEMLIDREARRGWKILADHVNKMDYAMKRRYILEGLGEKEKKNLRELLESNNPMMWANSPDELKKKLS